MRGEERREGGGVGDLFEWNISLIFKLPASPKLFSMACPLLFLLFLKWKLYSQEFWPDRLDVRRSPGLSPSPTDVNFTSPAPFTAPPPSTLVWIYDLYRNRVSVSPYIGKIIGMTFPLQNCTRFFANSFFLHFFLVLTNSFFHEKSLLSNFNPPLLHSYLQNPNIEPRTA